MKSSKLLLGVVALLAAAGAYWFLLLAPKREEAAALTTKVTQKQAEVAQAQATLATYRQAKQTFRVNYSTIARLGKAVPADDDVRSLVVQLEGAANKSDVDFRSIATSGGGGASTGTDAAAAGSAPPPGAQTVGSAGFAVMPFALQFKGGYMELSKLFTELDGFVAPKHAGLDVRGRLLRVEGFTLSPSSDGWKTLTAEITASTYLTPATEGLTGGATAGGPAPTTTSASTPSGTDDGGSSISPATITGALR